MFDIKSTSNAAWWIKDPKKHQHRTTFSQDMTDLFWNISMHGYNKFLAAELFLYEKLLWFCLHLVNLIVVITVLSYTWHQFASQYYNLYLHSSLYPIEYIPFPGVSICSNNRISRQAAIKYAQELSLLDPKNRSAAQFLEYMPFFDNFYFKFQRTDNFKEYEKFQSFLDMHGTDDNETFFNIRKTLKRLTPSCTDLIVKCFLNGKEINCFGENAFQQGFTMYGPCCIFNANNSYAERNSTFSLKTAELGLTVFLNSSHADDFVSLLNMDAYIVLIHSPDDFPDITTGNSVELFLENNMDSLIGVTAKFIDADEHLRTFHPSYRECYFEDEAPEPDMPFGKSYSFSDCVMKCRIRSVTALCNCVPFYLEGKLFRKMGVPYCNLNHVACLRRFNFKWRTVLTKRITTVGLEREIGEGLYCGECLPLCDDTQYFSSSMSLPTDRLVIPDGKGNDLNLKMEETSVLRVFFAKSTALYYRRIVSNKWQEAFSTVGNIVSIFLGFSLVAVFEILFFVIKYLCFGVKIFISHSSDNNISLKKRVKTKQKPLYILP